MDAYERICRLLLRAYPPRYRAERGEELLGTMLDMAADGRRRPPLRDSANLVRGGLATRWRARPPMHRWLLYRVFDWPVPPRWAMWVRDDAISRWYPVRRLLANLYLMPVVIVLSVGQAPWLLPASIGAIVGLSLLVSRVERKRTLARHGFHPDGTPLT